MNANLHWVVLTCAVMVGAGASCGHTSASPAAASPHTTAAAAPPATARSAEPHPTVPLPAALAHSKAPPLEPGPPPADESIGSVMAEHFAITNWARDVVISGQIDPLREALIALADYRYESVKPGSWEPWIVQLQAAARVTAKARDLNAAAKGIAAMGRVCGDCHRATGGGPKVTLESTDVFLPYSESFSERMDRHMWAAELLWHGIASPSEVSWKAGALALRDAPTRMDEWLPDEFSVALDEIRALGEQAQNTNTPADRGAIYGRVLTTCAGCHKRWMDRGL